MGPDTHGARDLAFMPGAGCGLPVPYPIAAAAQANDGPGRVQARAPPCISARYSDTGQEQGHRRPVDRKCGDDYCRAGMKQQRQVFQDRRWPHAQVQRIRERVGHDLPADALGPLELANPREQIGLKRMGRLCSPHDQHVEIRVFHFDKFEQARAFAFVEVIVFTRDEAFEQYVEFFHAATAKPAYTRFFAHGLPVAGRAAR